MNLAPLMNQSLPPDRVSYVRPSANLSLLLCLCAAVLFANPTALAQKTFRGVSNSGNQWSTSSYWSPTGVPTSSNDLVFDNSSVATYVRLNNGGTHEGKNVTFSRTDSGFAFANTTSSLATITFTSLTLEEDTSTLTIRRDTINANANLDFNTGSLVLNSGSALRLGNIAAETSSNLSLIRDVTVTGTTSLAGTLSLSRTNGTVNLGALTTSTGGVLNITDGSGDNGSSTSVANVITVTSLAGTAGTIQANKASTTGELDINGTTTTSFGGVIQNGNGTVRLVKQGNGVQTFTGANTYTGTTTISGGVLQLGDGGTTGSLSASSAITNNATLRFNRSNTMTQGADFSTAGIIGSGSVEKIGSGTLVFNAVNTYSGGTTISDGVLSIASTASLPGWNTNGSYSVANGAALAVGNSVSDANITAILGTTNFANGAGIGFDTTAGNRVYSPDLTDRPGDLDLALVKVGDNTLTISGTNTYSGGTTIRQGVLSIASTASLPGWNTNGEYSVEAGGALAVVNSISDADIGTILATGNFEAGAGIGFDTTAGDRDYDENIAGNVALVKVGANALTVSGNSNYTGGTLISEGTLIVASNTAVGGLTGGNVTLRGALESRLQINADTTIASNIVFSSTNADSLVSRDVGAGEDFNTGTSGFLQSDLAGGIETLVSVLDGSNTTGSEKTLEMSFSTISAALNDEIRLSDVFSLSGTGTDVFVMQLNVTGLAATDHLGWLNEDTGEWRRAINGNTGTGALGGIFYTSSFADFVSGNGGVFNPTTMLGAYGNDGAGNVWAVLNHNSDFAAVPEPRVWALAGIGMAAILLRLRRRR